MTTVDFGGAGAIVTGGTRGIGKAVGKELARAGATVFLTHRWGSVSEEDLVAEFAAEGLRRPLVVESDVSDSDDCRALMRQVGQEVDRLAVLVSNVAFAKVVGGLEDLSRRSFELSLGYSAWPIVDLLQAARGELGHLPRYVVAMSSDGGESVHPGYDLAGASKAALEALCRYLALRLRGDGVRVNVLRAGMVDTASARATFGDAIVDQLAARGDTLIDPAIVGRACVALCSGLMDGVTGQVITVDEGFSVLSPLARATDRTPAPFPRPVEPPG